MINLKKYKIANYQFILSSFLITFILIICNQAVDSERFLPWEPDDVLSYILKKEQFENCYYLFQIYTCDANEIIKNIFNNNINKSFKETIFFGRTILEYHILYSYLFYLIDIIFNNNFFTFNFLNYVLSFFLIFFVNKIISNFIGEKLYKNYIIFIFSFIFFLICLENFLLMRSASKLSLIFFLISFNNILKDKTCNLFLMFILSIFQIVSHPIGIVTTVIGYLSYFFKYIIKFEKKLKQHLIYHLFFTILSILFGLYLMKNPIVYAEITTIDLNYLKKNIYEAFLLNLESLYNYYKNINYFFKILLVIFFLSFFKKRTNISINSKLMFLVFIIVNIFSIININPTREIISYLNLVILLTLYTNLVSNLDFLIKKFAIKKIGILVLTFIIFSFIIAYPILLSDLKTFNLRAKRDHIKFDLKNPQKLTDINKLNNTIYFSSTNNNLFFFYLSNGLLDTKFLNSNNQIAYHGLNSKELNSIKYGVFDLFNNLESVKNLVDIDNDLNRSKSHILYNDDKFYVNNFEKTAVILELYSSKNSTFKLNDIEKTIKKDAKIKIKINDGDRVELSNINTKGFLKINSIKFQNQESNWPFEKNIELNLIYNDRQSRKIIFNNINPFKGCEIIKFLNSYEQDILTKLECEFK